MTRSTRSSLKFSNEGKRDSLHGFVGEYRKVVSFYVDLLWDLDRVPRLLPKEITSKPESWLSARARQCAAKQASGIVRGTRAKQERRKWQVEEFKRLGMLRKAKKLQGICDRVSVSKPRIDRVEPELDSRFVKVDLGNGTSFDGWITLSSIGNGIRLELPFRKTKHFNELEVKGKRKLGVRLSRWMATFVFEVPEPEKKALGSVLGIDVGKNEVVHCSDGFVSKKDRHGHDLGSIMGTMARRRKGSKGFQRCVDHRTNYVNWSINQLNLSNVRLANIENIKYLRRGKRVSRLMSHWAYAGILGKLERYCDEQGVLVRKVDPTYTSQRCSKCGWVRKGNRRGKLFKCDKCSLSMDSDLNASLNLSLDLRPVGRKVRLSHANRVGFYWHEACQEPIVPGAR